MHPFLERMTHQEEVFDLLLISCSKEEDANHWEKQLSRTLAITENWEGGAGNALGTLHAIELAERKAQERGLPSPLTLLKEGGKVALYHTAGKGSRMAPLTLAEGGMKAAIKLPAFLPDGRGPLSVLEMVIRQTAPLSSLSQGRLSVFWTDQLFLPSHLSWEPPKSDVEVYTIPLPPITPIEFLERNLSSYGLWEQNRYLDKLTLDQFQALPQPFEGALNLGSFSISYSLLSELLIQYQPELSSRKGKLDTDPDWWKKNLKEKVSPRSLGLDTDWWDFGTLESYRKQLQKILLNTPEASRLRALFGIPPSSFRGNSLVLSSDLENCSLNGSILLNTKAKNCHFDHTLAFDTHLQGSVLSHALIYGSRKN
jgi:hypothetical protein